MTWTTWLIEHSVEMVSLIVTIIGFWVAGKYLIKINNKQNINQINSPNSPIIQAAGDVTQSNLDTLKKESKKDNVAFSEEIGEPKTKSSDLPNKIEEYLDGNKPISLIAEMSLRLAKELKMKEDEEWLEKEVHGFREYFAESIPKKGLQMKKPDERFKHRRVDTELHIMSQGGKMNKFDVPMFFSESLRQIEDWVENYSKEQKLIMNAPPMELMVETLKLDPSKKVPYLVNPSSFKKILNEVRLKIIEFLDRVKEKKERK
jgi:AbiTii